MSRCTVFAEIDYVAGVGFFLRCRTCRWQRRIGKRITLEDILEAEMLHPR